ncbi:steroid dehydrogenase [Penicillium cataractarum]|uniref:Steroid dehydrogenase n=1 Tax=Penicillium cataractarum TaxID=2100454 RepID=A0A9W9SLY2_9EURO|nr:steroid dehydrogenase [Penicillium cataractarum]KAJ5380917.1 steroid dehydrogenase [Penicillium cataractarum]
MGIVWSQFFPPKPTLTEANLPSQKGKVFIVTGGYSGVGFELCKILYQAGGKVYLAGRSEEKALQAIADIKTASPNSEGEIVFLSLKLDDLTTIKPAVEKFMSTESRLDVLFNNAGVSNPPLGSISTQGHELQLATNCLGHHLLTQLLLPTLRQTAHNESPASARVIWLSSIIVDTTSAHGVNLEEFLRRDTGMNRNYENSKVGNWFLANDLAKQAGSDGILSVVVNPGNLKSNLTRHFPSWVPYLVAPLLYHPIMGAYSQLWAAFSPELTISDGGSIFCLGGEFIPSPGRICYKR